MSVMNDSGQLVVLLVTGDRGEAALAREFEQAVRDTSDLAVRVAFGVLRRREDAEEVAQEAFVRAHRCFAQLRDPEHFRAWMVRVTYRLAIDRWRSDRRRQAREEAAVDPPAGSSAEDLALASERAARLRAAIDDLPDKLRLVIILSAIDGHDVQEVARLLEIPVGTVKSRLFLARKGLAGRLQCLVDDSPAP